MRIKTMAAVLAGLTLTSSLVACSSSASKQSGGSTGSSSSAGASGSPIKIGVLTDLSGAASASYTTTELGIKAYVNHLNATGGVNGHKITYVMADGQSTAPGALTAAQKLVQSDKVFAIINNTSFFFAAQPYLLKSGVPVVSTAVGGDLINDPKQTNFFASDGALDPDAYNVGLGNFMKSKGVTKCGAVGYAQSVGSQKGATGFLKSCQAVGLQKGYLNNNLSFGTTDVAAMALQIKQSGTDGMYIVVTPSTGFALAGALRQIGAPTKALLLATGYGGDLLLSSAGVTAAQGDYFTTGILPYELNNAATQAREANFEAVGVKGALTFSEAEAYNAMAAFTAGLRGAGNSPTRESFMTAMTNIKDFDGEGLLSAKVDFRNYHPSSGCTYVLQLVGTTFKIQPGSPFCGPSIK
jgi:branched-chain amino acid transport system substrate-binding protein